MLRRLSNFTLILGFLVLLGLPLLLFSRSPATEPDEQRSAAPWPKPPHNLPGLTRFAAAFEAYFNDRFGLRQTLLTLRNRANVELLGQSPTDKVLMGRDNWLFHTGDHAIEDARGLAPLDQAGLEGWYRTIETRRRWLEARGIRYVFIVPPNKESIYPEYLPRSVVRGGPSRLDQLSAYLATKGERAWLGDLRPAMIAEKPRLPLYIPIDVHWNAFGSSLAYRPLIERLDQENPGVAVPLDLARALFAPYETDYGDLARAMGVLPYPVQVTSARYIGPPLACRAEEIPLEPLAAQTATEHVRPDRVSDCPAPAAAGAGRALVFHDSMMLAMTDYLANSFAHTRFAWMFPTMDDIERYVALEHPDVVIEEQVERTLEAVPRPMAVPDLVAGSAPALDRAGWFELADSGAGVVTVDGWGEWQPQAGGRRLGFDTNLPVTGSALGLVDRPDVAASTGDPRLAGAGLRLQLALDPAKPLPDKIRLCLWTEDPALGDHRLSLEAASRVGRDWDSCAAGGS